jgi:exonuclease SbcD
MTKFGFYTDLHLAGETPRHRVDDFPRVLLEKLREVYATFEEEGCQFVLFAGDFFNAQRMFSFDVISEAIEIVGKSLVKTYSVVGEHDLYGHNIETFQSSTLKFFVRHCRNMNILWEPTDLGEVVLYGKHEPDKMETAMAVQVDPAKYNILVCHELLTCNAAPFDVISTSTLTNCPYDLVVSGDLHDGFEPHHVEGTWFCNPGSLARRTIADADRWSQIALIEVEKGREPSIEYRRLACGKPGYEVFGESIAEAARAKVDFDADDFARELLEFEAEATDIHELVQKAGRQAGLRQEILDYLATKRGAKNC